MVRRAGLERQHPHVRRLGRVEGEQADIGTDVPEHAIGTERVDPLPGQRIVRQHITRG